MNKDIKRPLANSRPRGHCALLMEPVDESRGYLIPSLESLGLNVIACDMLADISADTRFELILVDARIFRSHAKAFRKLQQASGDCPLIVLTTIGQIDERLDALDQGADDYIVKPCPLDKMLDRIRTNIIRKRRHEDTVIEVSDLQVDPKHQIAYRGDEPIMLTPREFQLLYYLAKNQGEIVSRRQIIQDLYQQVDDIGSNVIDVYVRYLRKKIERPNAPRLLHTFRRKGYMLGLDLKDHHRHGE